MRANSPHPTADRLLRRLLWLGIADFLLISAFAIHRARRENWQVFDRAFADLSHAVFGQTADGWWPYAIAFPIVAINFGCMVAMLRGRRGLLWPFLASAFGIGMVEWAKWSTVVYRDLWSDMLTLFGYLIGGAIAAILYFRLDSASQGVRQRPTPQGQE